MEQWKQIKENTNYEISNYGNIRRTDGKKEHQTRDKRGYLIADLYANGHRRTFRVHRLVAQAFVPNPKNEPEVDHKDGNKYNNHYSNLEWVSKKENRKRAWENGLAKPSYGMKGKKNPNGGRKGKPFKIVETGEVFRTLKECEEAIDGNNRHISECLNGKQKTHRGYHFEYI